MEVWLNIVFLPSFGVVTWGDVLSGGDSAAVADRLAAGVISIVGNDLAFAALKEVGEVVTWGDADGGGDSSAVADLLTAGVNSIVGNMMALAALQEVHVCLYRYMCIHIYI